MPVTVGQTDRLLRIYIQMDMNECTNECLAFVCLLTVQLHQEDLSTKCYLMKCSVYSHMEEMHIMSSWSMNSYCLQILHR